MTKTKLKLCRNDNGPTYSFLTVSNLLINHWNESQTVREHRNFPKRWIEVYFLQILRARIFIYLFCAALQTSLKTECGPPGQNEFDTPWRTAQFKRLPPNPPFPKTCVNIGLKMVPSCIILMLKCLIYSTGTFTSCLYSYIKWFIVVALSRRNLQVSILLDGVYHVSCTYA